MEDLHVHREAWTALDLMNKLYQATSLYMGRLVPLRSKLYCPPTATKPNGYEGTGFVRHNCPVKGLLETKTLENVKIKQLNSGKNCSILIFLEKRLTPYR